MKITISNRIELTGAPAFFVKLLQNRLTIENPKWLENEKMDRWNGNTTRYLDFYEFHLDGGVPTMTLPRGFIRQLINLCYRHDVTFELEDHRRRLTEVDFSFHGDLKPFQQEAAGEMLSKDFGTLSAATGSGKTVITLYLIAERKQPALIIVHTKELLNQWVDRIETFLGIPESEIGIIGAGKKRIGDRITVALVQTLYKVVEDIAPYSGYLVVDECHRTPSRTFTEAVKAFDAYYMTGLSATPWRRDRLSKLIFWHIGEVVHEVDKTELVENGHILKAEIITRETDFKPYFDPVNQYSKMLSELTQDEDRNLLIAGDIAKESRNSGGVCLVLSDRKDHCKTIQTILSERFRISSDVLTGAISTNQRKDVVTRLNDGKIRILIATGQLIGEGFDASELSTLFFVTPVKFSGRVIQYLGRVLRPAPEKTRAKVFDYVDIKVPVLVAAAKARQRVYGGE